jgi:hypothetical protein
VGAALVCAPPRYTPKLGAVGVTAVTRAATAETMGKPDIAPLSPLRRSRRTECGSHIYFSRLPHDLPILAVANSSTSHKIKKQFFLASFSQWELLVNWAKSRPFNF